jgi:hypothetical protein
VVITKPWFYFGTKFMQKPWFYCETEGVVGNDETNKLAKQGALESRIMSTPFHHINHQTL